MLPEGEGEDGRDDDATDCGEDEQAGQVPAVAARQDLPECDDRDDATEDEREGEATDTDTGGVGFRQRDDVLDGHVGPDRSADRLRGAGERTGDGGRARAGDQRADARLGDDEPSDDVAVVDGVAQFLFGGEPLRGVGVGGGRRERRLESICCRGGSDDADLQVVWSALQRRHDEDQQHEYQDHPEPACHPQ